MDIVHLMHPQHLIFGFELFGCIFIFGKLKSATSKRDVPLNDTEIEMILDLRKEFYFGEDSPLIPDEKGNFTRPVNSGNAITESSKPQA